MTTIPIFFAVDDGYAPYLSVAIRSLTDNCREGYFCDIYVLIDRLSEENRRRLSLGSGERFNVTFVNVSEKLDGLGKFLHLRDYYSHATYYRFFIPELFPQFDKGIYLDCDIWVGGDVSELYGRKLGKRLVGAAHDDIVTGCDVFSRYTKQVLGIPGGEYFSAGVLLMNLAEMRRYGLEQAFAELCERRTFRVAQDQDYLNTLCYGKTAFIGRRWNYTAYPGIRRKSGVGIVHYKINFKPWHYTGIGFEKQFWETAEKTPYYSELRRVLNEYTDEDRARDGQQLASLMALAGSEADAAAGI